MSLNKCIFLIVCFFVQVIIGGPNSSARLFVDFDPFTEAIENINTTTEDKNVLIAVKVKGIRNLDGFSFSVMYDTTEYRFINFYKKRPDDNGPTFLESEGGEIGAYIMKRKGNTLFFAASLKGDNPDYAPDGRGILAVIHFEKMKKNGGTISINSIEFIDSNLQLDTLQAVIISTED